MIVKRSLPTRTPEGIRLIHSSRDRHCPARHQPDTIHCRPQSFMHGQSHTSDSCAITVSPRATVPGPAVTCRSASVFPSHMASCSAHTNIRCLRKYSDTRSWSSMLWHVLTYHVPTTISSLPTWIFVRASLTRNSRDGTVTTPDRINLCKCRCGNHKLPRCVGRYIPGDAPRSCYVTPGGEGDTFHYVLLCWKKD